MDKLSSTKVISGVKKVGDCCFRGSWFQGFAKFQRDSRETGVGTVGFQASAVAHAGLVPCLLWN